MDLSGHEGEIPLPISSTYVIHHPSSTRPAPLLSSTINNSSTEEEYNNSSSKKQIMASKNKVVRYGECLKNHAASMGSTATDGCGEFMPSGEEGSLEALKCSACSCHRNFHRKETEGEPSSYHIEPYHYYKPRNAFAAAGYMPTRSQPPALIMPLGAIHTSESDEIEDGYGFGGGGGGGGGEEMWRGPQSQSVLKKRFRTKFTQEQKEKMLGFAEKAGWKLQRQEEGSVQQFCQEIGVKRRVLKVWMHNNKHNLAKKSSSTSPQLQ